MHFSPLLGPELYVRRGVSWINTKGRLSFLPLSTSYAATSFQPLFAFCDGSPVPGYVWVGLNGLRTRLVALRKENGEEDTDRR